MSSSLSAAEQALREAALEYHRKPVRGKISVTPTKPLSNQRDLSLAYSPGVAYPCLDIQADPSLAFDYTSRGNLVGVITNGTAVLGLGDIGPLAGKPVMEGKGCLFKKFAGVDVFDIELAERDPDKLVEIIAALEPTLGGINLEDIKAPECFYIEKQLSDRLNIPVFHDDQHGTAIISSAALLNGLELVGKDIGSVKVAVSGAGAAAIACLDVMVGLGVKRENVYVCDSKGLIQSERDDAKSGRLDESKRRYCQTTSARTLADVVNGADVFLGCSAPGVLTAEMVKTMASQPIILALANPEPEIRPELAKAVRPDCIIATGRSDYPNQVNNVLCFPYIFRGALDAGASTITSEMEIAAVQAIAELAQAEQNEVVAAAYAGEKLSFGREYLIPKPFDPRLMVKIAPAVAQAAIDSGVARRPIADMAAYREKLQSLVYASGSIMKPIYAAAKQAERKRVAYAEGEDERVLRAVQIVVDEGLAQPVLIGRPEVIAQRVARFGLRLREGLDYEVVNVEQDSRYRQFWQTYHRLMCRQGVTEQLAKIEMRRRLSLIGTMLLHNGDVDGMICGTWSTPDVHLNFIRPIIGHRPGITTYACMNGLLLPNRQVFLVDTHVNQDPTAEQLAEITIMAAEEMLRFGIRPMAALLSSSNFGTHNHESAKKMRATLALVQAKAPWLEIDGEMHGDVALDSVARGRIMPDSTLSGDANLLVFPDLDSANIAYNLLKTAAGQGIAVGPVLLGAAKPVHVLTASATVRRVVNMTALTVVDANASR